MLLGDALGYILEFRTIKSNDTMDKSVTANPKPQTIQNASGLISMRLSPLGDLLLAKHQTVSSTSLSCPADVQDRIGHSAMVLTSIEAYETSEITHFVGRLYNICFTRTHSAIMI